MSERRQYLRAFRKAPPTPIEALFETMILPPGSTKISIECAKTNEWRKGFEVETKCLGALVIVRCRVIANTGNPGILYGAVVFEADPEAVATCPEKFYVLTPEISSRIAKGGQ